MSHCDYCFGCGNDITNKRNERRLLSTGKSQHVLSLWKAFVAHLDYSDSEAGDGYICRSCFSAYERYIALQNKIESNLIKYFDKFDAGQATPKRIKLDTPSSGPLIIPSHPSTSSSPDVGV